MNQGATRILLVEDMPADARYVMELLSEVGAFHYDVLHVTRIKEAIEFLKSEDADVILLDLSLPDGNGLDTVIQVYSAAPLVPIVIMSTFEDETLIAGAVEEGAQDYLVKGHVDSYLLIHSIKFAIERQRILNRKFVHKEDFMRVVNKQRVAMLEEKVDRLLELMGKPKDSAA